MKEEIAQQSLRLAQGSVAEIVIENCRAISVKAEIHICIPWLNLTRIRDSFSENSDISDRYLYNMPSLPDDFVARPGLVQTIKHTFSEKRIVVCHGMRGVGKTWLTIDYVLQHSNDYRHIFLFTDITAASLKNTCEALVKNMALIKQDDTQTDGVQLLKRWMEEQGRKNEHGRCLLILDGLHAYAVVKDLVPSNAHVLITSLRAFTGFGEVHVDVFTPEQAKALHSSGANPSIMGFLPRAMREGVESVYRFWRADLTCLHQEYPSAIAMLPKLAEGEQLEFDRKALGDFFEERDNSFDFIEAVRFLMRYALVMANPKVVWMHVLFKRFLHEQFNVWVEEVGSSENAYKFIPRK